MYAMSQIIDSQLFVLMPRGSPFREMELIPEFGQFPLNGYRMKNSLNLPGYNSASFFRNCSFLRDETSTMELSDMVIYPPFPLL